MIIALAVSLVSLTFKELQFAPGLDEGYYFRYAASIAAKGLSGFSGLFKEYLQNQQDWLFPSPLRAGFILLAAGWLKLLGSAPLKLVYLSLFSYVLFLCVAYYFSRKYLGERLAVLFTALLAFSPLQLAMSRRVMMESTVNLFGALAIWLFWDFMNKRGAGRFAALIAALAFSILVKETAVLLLPVFAVFLLGDKFICRPKANLKEAAGILILPLIAVGLVFWGLGCLPYLFATIKVVLGSPGTNEYAISFGSGPWYRYLIDYMLLSPWVVILALGFAVNLLLDKARDRMAIYFAFLSLAILVLFNFFTKNVRYVLILDMPMRLLALMAMDRICRGLFTPQGARVILILLVAALALSDYFNFYGLFVRGGIYDPVSFVLLKARQVIPFN